MNTAKSVTLLNTAGGTTTRLRVGAILDRIAADIDKLTRARRVDNPAAAAMLPGRLAGAVGG